MNLILSLFLGILFFTPSIMAKLPCDYLKMVDNNLMVQSGTSICLGSCPNDDTIKKNGIHIAYNQNLYFSTFVLKTKKDSFTIARSDGKIVLTCYETGSQCFAGTVPVNFPDPNFPSGLYLTGHAGGIPLSVFDPWTIVSTVRLDGYSTLSQVLLSASMADDVIRGWRLVTKGKDSSFSYTFTDREQLIVGDVDAATIYSTPNAAVVANGPVLVRNARTGCPVPLPRPSVKSALLIYVFQEDGNFLNCNLVNDERNFAYNVEMNRCLKSPTGKNRAFKDSYFKVQGSAIFFYNNFLCSGTFTEEVLRDPCRSGWNAIFLPEVLVQN